MYWFRGSEWTPEIDIGYCPNTIIANNVFSMFEQLGKIKFGLDLVEICGGEGRTSLIAVRRHLDVGENFDLVTNWDLNDKYEQEEVLRYFDKYRPTSYYYGTDMQTIW